MLMRALVRDEAGVTLRRVPAPVVQADDDVVIAVAVAGVCRTDLAVADGRLGAGTLVLGHECAGTVIEAGPGAGVAIGARVTVLPMTPAGWLGVDVDGAWAERVRVPASCVRVLPDAIDFARGAYVEPVAAAMGVLRAIARDSRVLVGGRGRIAELTARVLEAHGAQVLRAPDGVPVDVAVETGGALGPLCDALRDGGTLVVKSRGPRIAELDLGELVARELTVRGIGHGSFDAAIDWLASRRIAIDDLLAPPRPLGEHVAVLAAARRSEAQKQLFGIG